MSRFIDNIMARPTWQKAAIWVGTLAFVAYCSHQFLLSSAWDEEDKITNKISELSSSIAQEERIARELPRFRQEVKELEVKLKFALQELPDKREIDQFLYSVSNVARDAGLTVSHFKPIPGSQKEFYAEVPASIAVQGTFHQIVTFFDEVSHSPRIVNISQISIKEPEVGDAQVDVKGECVATTFRYLDEAERVQVPTEGGDQRKRRKK